MKPILLAAVVLAIPAAAEAQVAAGNVPNTFDRPTAAQPARPAPTRPAADSAAAAASPVNPQAQSTLLALVAGAQEGRIDYALMTDTLAAQVRRQEGPIQSAIQGFGEIQTVQFLTSHEGADIFVITFADALTEWRIGFDDAGKVDAFLFREAE